MPQVKDMSIRAISRECFVSTTTMFRFVRKLGFEGYSDFINYIRLTSIYQNDARPYHTPATALSTIFPICAKRSVF